MSFPASLTTRTVKGRFVTYPAGTAAKGRVRIVLNDFMQGPTDNAFVAPFDETIPLDRNGEFSILLPATNDPQWTPSYYKITITIGEKIVRDKFQVSYDETDDLDLSDVLNLPAPTPGESYLLASSKGVAGGVAGLGSDGKVPANQLPPASGGSVVWGDIEEKPATFPHDEVTYEQIADKPDLFPPVAHDHPMSNVTGLVDALGTKANSEEVAQSLNHKADLVDGVLASWQLPESDKTDVGLANVDNTSDVDKPVSTAQQAALDLKASLASPTFTGTVSGVSKSMVGLGNADNTSDANKPVSTAQQTALDLKANLASPTLTGAPSAPTATAGTNTTQLATTGFVTTAVAPKADASAVSTALAGKADLVGGVIPSSQIPSVAKTDFLGAVSSQAAMLALAGQPGDWVTRTDTGTTWQIIGSNPTQLSSWWQHLTPTDLVQSVNGQTGPVTLGKADVGLDSVDNTSDANKPLSTAVATSLLTKVNKSDLVINVKDAPYNAVGNGVADDTAAIQAALVAASASTSDVTAATAAIRFPAGTYLTSSPLNVYGDGVHIFGDGAEMSKIVNATSDIFHVQGYHQVWEKFSAQASTGGGHVFVQVGEFAACVIRDFYFRQYSDAKSIWTAQSADYLGNLVENGVLEGTYTATVPMWQHVRQSGGANACNINAWKNLWTSRSGNYVFWLEATSNYIYDNVFENINFEVSVGGAIKLLSATNNTIRNCVVYDVAVSAGGGKALRDLFYIGKNAGNNSHHNRLESVQRRDGVLDAGVVDIRFGTSQGSGSVLEGCGSHAGGAGFTVDLGFNEVLVINDAFTTYLNDTAYTHLSPLLRGTVSVASSSTPTPNVDVAKVYALTALAANATFGAPSGTPTDGQRLIVRIKDNGTSRTLTWNAVYRSLGSTILPAITIVGMTTYVELMYNSSSSTWDVVKTPATTVNVKDFGATGDGTTDDITAIRAAISALSTTGGVVVFPVGVYMISNTILISRPGIFLRGASKTSTIIRASTAMSAMVLGTGTSPKRARIVEDLTFDAAGVAVVVDALTYQDAGSTYRRCLFVGVNNTNYLSISGVHDILVQDCEFSGTGTTRGTAIPINNGSKRINILNNRFRYIENSIVVDTGVGTTDSETEYVFADSTIEGNHFDAAWWLIPQQASGSGGTVTYTGTILTDTSASFPALTGPNNFNVRVLATLSTGSGGTVTYPRVEVVDTAATFITSGVRRGMIVRSGTAFAVVANVRSETNLAVEEWLDDTDRSRVIAPTSGAAYTVYGVVIGSVQSNTSTTLTVTRWHDLTGATVTPSAATRYELLYQRPNYTIHSEVGTRNVRVVGNVLRRPWSDGISLYGPGVSILDNSIEDGEDMGITSNGTAIIRGNRIRRQGAGGIFSSGVDSIIEGNDVQDSTWVNAVDLRSLGDIMVYGGARTIVVGNKCRTSGTRPQSRHGIVLFDPATVDCVIANNESSGHSVADYRVDQTVTGTNDINFTKGVLVTGSGAGPQRLDIAGTSTPEGVVSAAVSSRFRRTDGGTATTLYIKETGTGNTGWTALGPAATIRVTSTTSTATPTPNALTTDVYELTALAVTAAFAAPAGTPSDGQSLLIRIKDNGSGQTLSWASAYRAIGTTLPLVTTAGKQLYVGCKYNANATKWDVLAVAVES